MIGVMDGECSISVIPFNFDKLENKDATEENQNKNDDSVDIADLQDVVSDNEEMPTV